MTKRILLLAFALSAWIPAERMLHAEPFGEDLGPDYTFSCGYSNFTAYYKAKVSTYYFSGGCLQGTSKLQVPWSATGTYEPASGYTTEQINISGASPNRGSLQSTMTCAGLRENQDPWLTKVICFSFNLTPQGEFVAQKLLLDAIYKEMQSRGGPLTASFPYDRNALLAKRDADLKAEAVALAKAEEEKRRAALLQQYATQKPSPYSAALSPTILAPTSGGVFYPQTPVPIRLAPPKGWSVTSYLVTIQRKNASGNWVVQTNLPIAAAQAQSAAGYTEFGAGGSGPTKYPQSLTSPGGWRLNAQVSAPRQSGWSDWVEFSVTTPPSPTARKRPIPGVFTK